MVVPHLVLQPPLPVIFAKQPHGHLPWMRLRGRLLTKTVRRGGNEDGQANRKNFKYFTHNYTNYKKWTDSCREKGPV